MISIFLGAGFSRVAGVPLASELFDVRSEVDRITRQKLIERVQTRWIGWKTKVGGTPEEYLAYLQGQEQSAWRDAVWYVSLVVALAMGQVERVGMKPTITRHNVNRTTGNQTHEDFWTEICKYTSNLAVVTTNYDVLPERGLRHRPRPRKPRPGFHYGKGEEQLEGGGYPSYSHIQRIKVSGTVPLLKLHGSISWSVRQGQLHKYHDCRPAIRGDAAVVAPITNKTIPPFLAEVWQQASMALSASKIWIVVGYSLPEYDLAVKDLLLKSSKHYPVIHVFDPDTNVIDRYANLLPHATLSLHSGLPVGVKDLADIVKTASQ